MEPFRYHVFVCNQEKPEGVPCCRARGAMKVIDALRAEIMKQGLDDDVQITTCGSIGLCESGPNMIVYPEGTWYSGITPNDVHEIVAEHFKHHRPVERLVRTDADKLRSEIDTNKAKMRAAMRAREESGMVPDDVMNTIRAFWPSRTILTAVELDVFSAVGDGADADTVAEKIGTDARATEMLLNALVALDLLQKQENKFFNTSVSSRYLREGGPDDSRLSLMHSVHLWPRWSTLTECVREGTSVTYESMKDRSEDWTRAFIGAMHKSATPRAKQVAERLGADRFTRMLDVGGGSGAYAIAFAQANPQLTADIFDIPNVVPIANEHIKAAGIADRVKTVTGDLYEDDFGEGYDLVFISAICHMLDDQHNRMLLSKSFDALTPGGQVVIQDFILENDKTAPTSGALFALNMLVATKAGNSYSEAEYFHWLQDLGFSDLRHLDLMGPTGLIVGTRP